MALIIVLGVLAGLTFIYLFVSLCIRDMHGFGAEHQARVSEHDATQ